MDCLRSEIELPRGDTCDDGERNNGEEIQDVINFFFFFFASYPFQRIPSVRLTRDSRLNSMNPSQFQLQGKMAEEEKTDLNSAIDFNEDEGNPFRLSSPPAAARRGLIFLKPKIRFSRLIP